MQAHWGGSGATKHISTAVSAIVRHAVVVACMLFAMAALQASHARSQSDFNAFLQSLWPEAQKLGVSRGTFDEAVRGLKPNYKLPDLELGGSTKKVTGKQAEFTKAPRDYLSKSYLTRLASTGQKLEREHRATLDRIEREIGVDRFAVLAIWGRETSYGRYNLPHDAIRALATQAYTGRRKALFREEFLHALKMLEAGVPRSAMKSSWAGAIGLTQFMPTEFFKHATSFSGGNVNLATSVDDALASAAMQLKNKGWVTGQTWGYEVVIPASSSCALEGPPGTRTVSEWLALGYARVANRAFPAAVLDAKAYLMSPAGAYGPSFLALENFQVLRRYNTSDLYATFVGNLADRIAGGGDFITRWDDIGDQQTRIIRGVQQVLKDQGYPISIVDGFIGSNTRRQVGIYQARHNLKVDCWPTANVLRHMTAREG